MRRVRQAVNVPAERRRPRTARTAAVAAALLVASFLVPGAAGSAAPASPHASDVGEGFSHGSVTVQGDELHYVTGGDGPPVVLVHGWPQTWWQWHEVMPDLAEDHTVYAFDLPGLGGSEPTDTGYDKESIATKLWLATMKLGHYKVDFVGHDLGGLVAYPYARKFPWAVDRVVAIDTPLPGFGLEDVYGISWHFRFNMSPEPIPEDVLDDEDVDTYLGMMFDNTANPAAIDRQVYFDAYADADVRSAGYEYYRAFGEDAEFNQSHADSPLSMPVLAIGGEHTFGPMVGDSFSQVADDVRPVVAPGSGHFVAEETPQFLADCLGLFLGSGSSTPPPELAGCAP